MNFRLFNVVLGVNSLVSWGRPFREAAKEAEALAYWRAEEEGSAPIDALTKNFSERRLAQVSFTLVTLAVMLGVVWLATYADTPEWLLCLVALMPGCVLSGTIWLERRLRTQWRI